MTSARPPLQRLLPPLLVLGGLAALLAVTFGSGTRSRDREEALLRAKVAAPISRIAAGPEVDAYVARHAGDARARWFAIEMHARRLDVGSALAAFQGDPAFRDAPGAARRFAAMFLRQVGERPADGPPATALFPSALLARLDSGDPDAPRTLLEVADRVQASELVLFYLPAHRAATRGSAAMADSWRRRDELEFRLASACIRARPNMSEVAATLLSVLESSWRSGRPLLWNHTARAVGTLGDAASVEALRRERDAATGDGPDDRRRRLATEVGLAVAGDAASTTHVLEALRDGMNDWAGVQLAIGLHARFLVGDAGAVPALVALGQVGSAPTTRLQIGVCALLSDAMPEGLPADRWAEDLARHPMRTAHVVAHAWALRKGAPGAVATLLEDLADAVRARNPLVEAQTPDDDDGAAVVEALRALARWG